MTVYALNLVTQYTGTGARTYFEYGFEVIDGVRVLVNGIPVSFVAQELGVVIEPAPALNATILIYRETNVTQLADFQPFESFDAAKTEDACDKLIYLKQEALIWRAQLNLYAQPYLDRVEVVNDKGTDAILWLWNTDKAGMFAGEVTTQMPNAGTFVEKPWDFAYFQYGSEVVPVAMILTTTPYPIEVIDELQLVFNISDECSMSPIPGDAADYDASLIAASLVQVLISYGPDNDNADYDAVLISADLQTILIFYGPDNDDADYDAVLIGAELVELLVTVDTPDEKLQLAMDVVPEGCSMTPV